MSVSVLSATDPFIIDDKIAPGVNSTGGLVPRSLAINPTKKTLVLIASGQSLLCNTNPTLYTPTNNAVIDNFNIYDGAAYPISGPLLGCTNSTLGPGNMAARIADLFVTNARFDRVILVPIAIGGTFILDWSGGHLSAPGAGGRFGVAMRRLAAAGITQATTGVTFGHLIGIGETDNANGTTQATYQSQYSTYIGNCASVGFTGRTFITLETLWNGTTSSALRAAQAALVNNTTVFQAGDTDTLTGGTNRQVDGTHLTDAGAASGATLHYNAMHASGSPY